MLMIEGTESKDYSILAPVMEKIEESETISKLKKIGNVNSEQERIEKTSYNIMFLIPWFTKSQ